MLKCLPPLAVIVLAAVLPGIAAAQPVNFFSTSRTTFVWPGDGPTGLFGRAVHGEFNGDGIEDIVQVRAGRACLLFNPRVHSAVLDLGVEVADIAVLPAGNPVAAGRDALLATTADGLVRIWIQGYGTAVSALEPESSDWRHARCVRVADLDGDGLDDALGVDATGEALLLALGAGLDIGATAVVPVASVLTRVEPLQWIPGDEMEVAALGADALQVLDLAGIVIAQIPTVPSYGAMAVLRDAEGDQVAWMADAGGGSQFLMVADKNQPLGETPLFAGPLNAVGLASADLETPLEADGDGDLFIAHRFSHWSLLALNQSHSPQVPGAVTSFGYDPLQLAGVAVIDELEADDLDLLTIAEPLLADFDGDGDFDAYQALETKQKVTILDAPITPAAARNAVDVTAVGYGGVDPELGWLVGLELQGPAVLPEAATHVELQIWRLPTPEQKEVQSNAVANYRIELAEWPLYANFHLPEFSTVFVAHYEVTARMIGAGLGGDVAVGYPLWRGTIHSNPGLALTESGTLMLYEEGPASFEDGGEGGGGPEPKVIGGVAPRPNVVIPFPDPPDPGAGQTLPPGGGLPSSGSGGGSGT